MREVNTLLSDPQKIAAEIERVQAESSASKLDLGLKNRLKELKMMQDVALKKQRQAALLKGESAPSLKDLKTASLAPAAPAPALMQYRPQDSVYFHPTHNPSGAPPRGAIPMYKAPGSSNSALPRTFPPRSTSAPMAPVMNMGGVNGVPLPPPRMPAMGGMNGVPPPPPRLTAIGHIPPAGAVPAAAPCFTFPHPPQQRPPRAPLRSEKQPTAEYDPMDPAGEAYNERERQADAKKQRSLGQQKLLIEQTQKQSSDPSPQFSYKVDSDAALNMHPHSSQPTFTGSDSNKEKVDEEEEEEVDDEEEEGDKGEEVSPAAHCFASFAMPMLSMEQLMARRTLIADDAAGPAEVPPRRAGRKRARERLPRTKKAPVISALAGYGSGSDDDGNGSVDETDDNDDSGNDEDESDEGLQGGNNDDDDDDDEEDEEDDDDDDEEEEEPVPAAPAHPSQTFKQLGPRVVAVDAALTAFKPSALRLKRPPPALSGGPPVKQTRAASPTPGPAPAPAADDALNDFMAEINALQQ